MSDPDATDPGLTQNEDGSFSIGPGGLARALKDQADEMKRKQDEINAETKKVDKERDGG